MPSVQLPIVLVHGILGFNQLSSGGVTIATYFRGIAEALRAAGNTVPIPPQLNPAGRIEDRAAALKKYLEDPSNSEIVGKQVHLIAHSLGGLDSRYMISRLDMAARVRTLTTIGSPHQGTVVADEGLAVLRPLIDIALAAGVDIRGFADLTTSAAGAFNSLTPDSSKTRYFSVAGDFAPALTDILRLPHDLIAAKDGPNDGLVSVASAQHGEFLGTWKADHFRLINWATNILTPLTELTDPSIVGNYNALIQKLADEGF